MTKKELKQLIREVIIEQNEQSLVPFQQVVKSNGTVNDFMETLVGKKLKNLLDAASFARLYVMNKYGVGGDPDDQDIQALVSNLMDSVTSFINFRKLDPIGKQRSDWEKVAYNTPEYKDFNVKRNAALKALFVARRSGDQSEIDKAQKNYDDIKEKDPSSDDYRKMTADRENLVKQFHNTPLTLQDVLPGPDDSEEDKKRWKYVEKAFNALKNFYKKTESKNMTKQDLKKLVKEVIAEQNALTTLQISTVGGGTTLLLYRGADARYSDRSSDKHYKTPTQFKDLIASLNSTRGMATDEAIKNILRRLTPEQLKELVREKVVVSDRVSIDEANTKELQKLGFTPTKSYIKEVKGYVLGPMDQESTWIAWNKKPKNKNGKQIYVVSAADFQKQFPSIQMKELPAKLSSGADYYIIDSEGDLFPYSQANIGSGLD